MAEVAAKIAEQLASRGGHSLGGLARQFKIMDDAGDKKLDAGDLKYGLQDFGIEISSDELAEFIAHADSETDGVLTYNEFIVAIRGPMSDDRKAVVDQAYAKFDADGNGFVKIDDIKAVYSADEHPKVISGEMTPDQVFAEFLQAFGDKDADGMISQDEWYTYYNTISAGVDNDEEFALIITNAWKLNE
eukprot:TRINITY_DN53068_c0_g1_i1.p1 TRINITY_DN53068_c0_g1~~TRINITY_DN53068_c0_g1_i1.p1  ORF type:complete len:189 (-),score=46.22 TRINITY_DN53068_c0_g1_i1:104-670(-)